MSTGTHSKKYRCESFSAAAAEALIAPSFLFKRLGEPMMTALDPKDQDRLVKLLGMLGSDFDGERAAAGALAHRLIRERGLTWRALLGSGAQALQELHEERAPFKRPRRAYTPDSSFPPWRDMARAVANSPNSSPWEVNFCHSLLRYGRDPTPKQYEVLAMAWRSRVDEFCWAGGAR